MLSTRVLLSIALDRYRTRIDAIIGAFFMRKLQKDSPEYYILDSDKLATALAFMEIRAMFYKSKPIYHIRYIIQIVEVIS